MFHPRTSMLKFTLNLIISLHRHYVSYLADVRTVPRVIQLLLQNWDQGFIWLSDFFRAPSLAALSVQSQTHFSSLVLPNYLLYYSSALLLLFFVAWNVLYPLSISSAIQILPTFASDTISPWNFPLTEVKCRLLTPRISYFVCTYLMAVKMYSFMVIQ